jgi:hypothetical protein
MTPEAPLHVVLIGCGKSKVAGTMPVPARELYTSSFFKLKLRWADAAGTGRIFVLSAKHHLVPIDKPLRPYDQTLESMSTGEREGWSALVVHALVKELHDVPSVRITLLASRLYADPIVAIARPRGWPIETPLSGLSILRSMRWLNERSRKAA